MIPYEDDEDERKDSILKDLEGEVDDYAGSQMKDPNAQGVTIEISIKPHGGSEDHKEPDGDEEKDPSMVDGNEEHDPIAHILGMCGGGCAGK